MDTNDEKRFQATPIHWSNEYDEYVSTGEDLILNGVELGWDTYAEFLAFMASLSKDEAMSLCEWSVTDEYTNHSIHISDGIFDEVSFMSIFAEKYDAQQA